MFLCNMPFVTALSRTLNASSTAVSAAALSPDAKALRALLTVVLVFLRIAWFLIYFFSDLRWAFVAGNILSSM